MPSPTPTCTGRWTTGWRQPSRPWPPPPSSRAAASNGSRTTGSCPKAVAKRGAAALAGRRLCRRALRPLTGMAAAARAISADDLGRRLPPAGTGDEVDDLGRAFNELLARLQESFERQRRFTGDASHQLRTPLAAMLGQVEVALRRERPPEEYQRVLTLVHKQSAKLREIVEMLLFLSRADAEAKRPQLEALDLA